MVISYTVMHLPGDPLREGWLRDILRVYPEAVVSADVNRSGLWPAAKRAWDLACSVEEASHICVLQDDMLPLPGGRERLESAVREHDWTAVSGFQPSSWFASDAYHRGESPIFVGSGHVWGGAVVLPRYHAERWTAWADEHAQSLPLDDAKLSAYLIDHDVTVYHAYPSCWDHLGWNTSAIGSPPNEWRRGLGAPRIEITWPS